MYAPIQCPNGHKAFYKHSVGGYKCPVCAMVGIASGTRWFQGVKRHDWNAKVPFVS